MFILQLVYNLFYVFELLLIIYALLSWFPNAPESGLGKMVQRIVEPFLGLLDFTVLVALLVLSGLQRFVLQVLAQFL